MVRKKGEPAGGIRRSQHVDVRIFRPPPRPEDLALVAAVLAEPVDPHPVLADVDLPQHPAAEAVDLLEELRPALVDRLSVNLLNLGVLQADDFTTSEEKGCLLTKEALKRYFAAYEKELTTPFAAEDESLSYRALFRRQAERLARSLTEGEAYEPFRLPC